MDFKSFGLSCLGLDFHDDACYTGCMFDVYMDDVRNAPHGWKLTRTLDDTKALLIAGLVDQLSLDHDMGEFSPTGMDLVDWMVQTRHWPKFKPVVHSANPVGKLRMQMTIERYWDSRHD